MSRFERINDIAKAQDEGKELDDYDQADVEAVTSDLADALAIDDEDDTPIGDIEDADAPEAPIEDTPPVYKKEGVWYTKEKVNGVEREVPFDTILAKSQKIEAADQYLRDAAAQKRAMDDLARKTLQQPPNPGVAEDIKALGRAYTEAVVAGDDELAAELWEKTFKATQAPRMDPEAISQLVESRLTEKQLLHEKQTAFNRLQREHPDVFNDPDLFYQADMMTLKIERENPHYTPTQVLEAAVLKVKRAPPGPSPTGRSARKKPGMSVTGAGAKLQQQRAAPATVGDTINQLRIARGKPPIG